MLKKSGNLVIDEAEESFTISVSEDEYRKFLDVR
jgi:hypothetical protein